MDYSKHKIHSIALVGIDGSGKSTQAKNLSQWLKQQNYRVFLIHPFGWKLLPFLSEYSKTKLARQRESSQAGKTWRGGRRLFAWMEVLDIGVYVWLAWIRCFLFTWFHPQEVWLVSDRSFVDLLVKHQHLHSFSPRVLASLRRFVPEVDQTIWLCTEPAVAMLRDADFPALYYEELHLVYQEAARQHEWLTIPTTDRTREAVFNDLVSQLGLEVPLRGDCRPIPVDTTSIQF